jgi:hypothetical protein
MSRNIFIPFIAALVLCGSSTAQAGVVNPDCTAEKAAKSAATKATVGVGGRCSPAEAAKDTAGLDKKDKDKKDKNKDKDKDDKKIPVVGGKGDD